MIVSKLVCGKCLFTAQVPEHHGMPMRIATVGWIRKRTKLVCQKRCIYSMEIPVHCGELMRLIE